MHADFTRNVGQDLVPVFEFHLELSVWQRVGYQTFDFNNVLFCQILVLLRKNLGAIFKDGYCVFIMCRQ